MLNNTFSLSKILTQVDRLVIGILDNQIAVNELAISLTYLYPAMMYYDEADLEHTQTIKWFIGAAHLLKGGLYPNEVVWDISSTLDFMTQIQSYTQEFNDNRINFDFREIENTRSLDDYLTSMFSHYSRLLVVRIDLKYKCENQSQVTVQDFNNHISTLRDRIRRKKGVFKFLEGYAWTLEQGYKENYSNGLHCHLVLLYDGSKRHKGSYIGQQIGEKWEEMTEGLGTYFNCNDPKYVNSLKDCGIGMIHRNNPYQVQTAIKTILYLTTKRDKFEQRLKSQVSGMKTFSHGIYKTKSRRFRISQY